MGKGSGQDRPSRPAWPGRYVLGLGVGTAASLYGIIALAMGRTFLPGRHAHEVLVGGRSGFALALAYLLGGVYLLVRHFLEGAVRSGKTRARLRALENALLVGFIGALVYVLLHVGEAG